MTTKQPFENLAVTEEAPVEWGLDVPGYLTQRIDSSILTNHRLFDAERIKESLLIVRGYGEQDKWVATRILAGLAILDVPGIVVGVGIDQPASSDMLSLESYAHQSIGKILLELQERELTGEKTKAVGHSFGGALVGLSLKEYPELLGDVGFEEPVAHDSAYRKLVEPDDKKRMQQFAGEFFHVLLGPYSGVSISDKLLAAKSIFGQLLRDGSRGDERLHNCFSQAVTLDAMPYVIEHAANGNNVVYVLGSNDPISRELRITQSQIIHAGHDDRLKKAVDSISIISTEQKHSYMGWNDGMNHLRIVTGHLGLHDLEIKC